jgi:hypothetical protein
MPIGTGIGVYVSNDDIIHGGVIPAVSTATIENSAPTHVVITFDVALNTTAPATTAFALAGKTISNVSISGAVVTLTVSVAYVYGNTVSLSYTQPVLNPLKALIGGSKVTSFEDYPVVNNVAFTPQYLADKLLFWGKVSEIAAGAMPNKVTGASDSLTVGGSAGSYTFQAPNTTPYKNADTDYIWFKTDETLRTTTEAELVGYDFPRTLVKYDNTTPYAIREIIILKAGATLTTAEENLLRDYMELSIWWSDVLSAHGVVKGNRSAEKSDWIPESIYDAASANLFSRLLAKGETPTDLRKTAIDTAIKALKAASLFDTQFDVFVVTRGIGAYTRKENWIKDSSHALAVANGGTLSEHDDVGIHSDGTKSYLNSQFTPSTDGVLFTKNNACFGYKDSGTIGTSGSSGSITGGGQNNIYFGPNVGAVLNSVVPSSSGAGVGYNCVTRSSSSQITVRVNASSSTHNSTSTQMPNLPCFLLADNVWGGTGADYFHPATDILEMYYFGKALSSDNFSVLQTIMNTYFPSL